MVLGGAIRGPKGYLIGGSGEGDIFASQCILKVEYAKGLYIPGLEITRFAPEFRGFGKKWASSATIHSESDCSHI